VLSLFNPEKAEMEATGAAAPIASACLAQGGRAARAPAWDPGHATLPTHVSLPFPAATAPSVGWDQ